MKSLRWAVHVMVLLLLILPLSLRTSRALQLSYNNTGNSTLLLLPANFEDLHCPAVIPCDDASQGFASQCCNGSNCCFYRENTLKADDEDLADCRKCYGSPPVCCPESYCCVPSWVLHIMIVGIVLACLFPLLVATVVCYFYYNVITACGQEPTSDLQDQLTDRTETMTSDAYRAKQRNAMSRSARRASLHPKLLKQHMTDGEQNSSDSEASTASKKASIRSVTAILKSANQAPQAKKATRKSVVTEPPKNKAEA